MRLLRVWVAAVVVAAAPLLVAACGSDDDTSSAERGPGVEHVHGLGIDPADGTLYAATHFGLFRVPERGRATRVADRYQDTMGFTVVGPGHFFGSGHPDLQQSDLPPLLGLIESDDAGRNWKPISLLGEADFHALVFRHGLTYGYDATGGRFMVSPDGRAWETRAEIQQLISFAVDPANPERLLATTASGLRRSIDGGRTWSAVAGPPLVLVSWAEDGTLSAVSPTGDVHLSSDSGASWTRAGSLPGSPEALLTIDRDDVFAAVEGGRIYESSDGGATWRSRYRQDRS